MLTFCLLMCTERFLLLIVDWLLVMPTAIHWMHFQRVFWLLVSFKHWGSYIVYCSRSRPCNKENLSAMELVSLSMLADTLDRASACSLTISVLSQLSICWQWRILSVLLYVIAELNPIILFAVPHDNFHRCHQKCWLYHHLSVATSPATIDSLILLKANALQLGGNNLFCDFILAVRVVLAYFFGFLWTVWYMSTYSMQLAVFQTLYSSVRWRP